MAEYDKKYNPHRSAEWNYGGQKWRLSRSKIDFFCECPRCFYLDNVLGTKRPSFPSFNLNIAVDELLKNEFDTYRAAGEPHPIMSTNGLEAVPFHHTSIDEWRDPFVGISYTDPATGLTVCGGIDDVWQATNGTLIVVDYKSTAKEGRITALSDSPWDQQYARQLSIYRWLFEKNNFTVSSTGYLVYANAQKDRKEFANILEFETTLVPVITTTDWIEPLLMEIKHCLDSTTLPPSGEGCEFCPYREHSGKKLQAIFYANQTSSQSKSK
jgi:hypothetical protein